MAEETRKEFDRSKKSRERELEEELAGAHAKEEKLEHELDETEQHEEKLEAELKELREQRIDKHFSLIFIINGEDFEVKTELDLPLKTAVDKALIDSGNIHIRKSPISTLV
jgi:ribosome-binding ATPase YchF (GTP1/OBG family)